MSSEVSIFEYQSAWFSGPDGEKDLSWIFVIVSPTRSGDTMDSSSLSSAPSSASAEFLVSDLQSTFLSGFLSYLAGGLIW